MIKVHSSIVWSTIELCNDNNNEYYANVDGYRLDPHDETDVDITKICQFILLMM